MSHPSRSMHDITKRLALLNSYKREVRIGIFGSFYKTRKDDLIRLRSFLREHGYTQTRLSEDLDDRSEEEREIDNPRKDLELSLRLIRESDIHIFVMHMGGESDPVTLQQSSSMELSHLFTLHQEGCMNADYVGVYIQIPLRERGGGVFRGVLMEKEDDWVIEDFQDVEEIFQTVMQFCYGCVRDIFNFDSSPNF